MTDYGKPLREQDVDPDPFAQFAAWHREAEDSDIRLAEAAALATASPQAAPSLRMVLVKDVDPRGFTFFSNYDSRKGRELAANPRAALLFHWDLLGRQVRVEGAVVRVSREETVAYAHGRARGSQLSALASPQSEAVAGREVLERRVAELEAEHPQGELPVAEDWGGFRLRPEVFEFWQQRADRLHDRLRFRPDGDGGWKIERLAP